MSTAMIQTLADALANRGYDTLTQVQQAVSDPELAGRDMLVSAQTGSGKTVGFGLAIAPTILDGEKFDRAGAPLALVIAPTRELAMQVKRELMWLYAGAGAVVASCVGGMDARDERRALDRGAHIVVATPGRLRDHIQRGTMRMGELRAVVLDEADEMLDLGFREDLEFILGESPETRQTLLFSATVPRMIATLAKTYQRDAVRVETVAEKSQHADIEYLAMQVAQHDAENALINVLRYYEAPNALVFCNTRAMVNRLTTRFSNRGFSVVALSGELTQNERTHALQAMRDGRARVCVATDVAARGIDLPNLELVVHAELPSNSETLLHRSGRTGRAGRKGVSALIVPPKVSKKAQRLLGNAKVSADWRPAPSAEDVRERDQDRMMADEAWTLPISEDEAPQVEKLTSLYDADTIAAAYLRLYHTRQSAPEDLSDPGARPERKPQVAFGPSTWFSVSVGRQKGAEVRRILPIVCNSCGLTKDDIGAIRLQFNETFVEIKESSAKGLDGEIKLEDGLTMTRLPGMPDMQSAPRGDKPDFKKDRGPRKPREDRKPRDDRKPREDRGPRKPREDFATKPDGPQKAAPRKSSKRVWTGPDTTPTDDPRTHTAQPKRADPRPERTRPDGVVKAKKPRAGAGGKPPRKDGPDRSDGGGFKGKPRGKPNAGAASKPAGKGKGKGKSNPKAADTSKRFVPPSKIGAKPKGKSGGRKGGDAPPRRKS